MESITKYLDPNIFQIDVVTLHEKDAPSFEIKGNVTIHRIHDTSFFRPFHFSENTNILFHTLKVLWNVAVRNFWPEHRGWGKNALLLIQSLQKEKAYDIILSSYSPAAAHEVALAAKKNSGGQWIADMRDEMSLNPFLSSIQRRQLSRLEQKIFDSCDMITSVSKPILDDFKRLAGAKGQNIRFVEIRNGYDFPLIETPHPKNRSFTISHIGSFYGERNPSNFLAALSLLRGQNRLPPVTVKLIGISKPITIPENLLEVVEVSSAISYVQALETMRGSDSLLLIHPTNGSKGVYTGKLFEYLGMQKPIIALIDPEDVAAQLIQKANAGFITDNSDIKGIQETILEAYGEWRNQTPRKFNAEIISKHHRKEQTKRLEKAILELLS